MRLVYGIVLVTLVCLDVQATQLNNTIIGIDDLRKGFEMVYFITNTLIDNMTPNLPKVFYENVTKDISIFDLVNRTKEIDPLSDWKYYGYEIVQTYPYITGFLLFSILFIFLIPFIGFICCIKNCCFSKKFFPYDGKRDKPKRIFYSFILFILLTLVLMLVIILFATNSYSLRSIEKTPKVIKSQVDSFKYFLDKDIKEIVSVGLGVTQNVSGSFLSTHKQVKNIISNRIMLNLTKTIENTQTRINHSLMIPLDIINELKSQSKAPVLNEWKKSVESLKAILKENPQFTEQIELFDTSKFNSIMELLSSMTVKSEVKFKEFVSEFNTLKKNFNNITQAFEDDSINEVNHYFDKIHEVIEILQHVSINTLSALESSKLSNGAIIPPNFVANYFNFYYAILILSSLMLLLFILFSFGLLGICCPRPRPEYKKGCNRGIAASCLTCGVVLFFLFASLIMAVCSIFMVSGMFGRQLFCEPLLELDNNQLIKSIKSIREVNALVGQTNFKNLFSECRTVDSIAHSKEINKLANVFTNGMSNDLFSLLNQTKMLQEIENHYASSIDTFDFEFFNTFNSQNVTNMISSFQEFNLNITLKLQEANNEFQISYDTNFEDLMNNYEKKLRLRSSLFDNILEILVKHNIKVNNITELVNHEDLTDESREKIEKTVAGLNETIEFFEKNEDQNIKETIQKFKEISNEYQFHLKLLNESIIKLKDFSVSKNNSVVKLKNDLIHFSNEEKFRDYLKKVFYGISNETIIPFYGKELNRTIPKLIETLPSCRGLSSFYDNITSTICYEYMDNYNAFWFSTYILLLVYCFVAMSGSKLSKLFKKSYSHSEVFYDSFEDSNGKINKKHFYLSSEVPLNQLSSNGSRRIRPIDAYSDKETNNYIFNHNQQNFNQNHTPPPSYKPQPL